MVRKRTQTQGFASTGAEDEVTVDQVLNSEKYQLAVGVFREEAKEDEAPAVEKVAEKVDPEPEPEPEPKPVRTTVASLPQPPAVPAPPAERPRPRNVPRFSLVK